MTRLALATALLASTALADVPYWHGPGGAPCDPDGVYGPAPSECSLDWAVAEWQGHLPESTLAHLAALIATTPPARHYIRDGDLIDEMGEAGPRMLHAPRVAALDEPVALMGWRVGSYIIGIVEECGNPAVALRRAPGATAGAVYRAPAPTVLPPIYDAHGAVLSTLPLGARGWVHDHDDCGCRPDEPMVPDAPAPVPLPAPLWALLAALAGLGMLKWRRTT